MQQNTQSTNSAKIEQTNNKLAISKLLQIETNARNAITLSELLYVIVNETSNLVNYRQAVFLSSDNEVKFVSNAASFEKTAPYIVWLKKLNQFFLKKDKLEITQVLKTDLDDSLIKGFDTWCQNYLVFVPLTHPRFGYVGSFICTRAALFNQNELTLLKHLSDTYAHALIALNAKPKQNIKQKFKSKKAKYITGCLIAFLILMCIPVRLSAIGDAEVVSKDFVVLRSPLDGTIESITVEPNQSVKKDQVVAKLNVKEIENQLNIAYKDLEVEKVKLQQLKQRALSDMRSIGDIAISKAAIDTKNTEISYLENLIQKANIKSPIDGVASFTDRMELEGLPVHVGSKIIDIADPKDTRVTVFLSIVDAMDIEDGNDVTLFLNISPNTPIDCKVIRMSYIAESRPEGYMAYRIVAKFNKNDNLPRVGLRGVAKVYGPKTMLGYYLFKRPILVVRQFLGF